MIVFRHGSTTIYEFTQICENRLKTVQPIGFAVYFNGGDPPVFDDFYNLKYNVLPHGIRSLTGKFS